MAPINEAFAALDPAELTRIQHDHALSKGEFFCQCSCGSRRLMHTMELFFQERKGILRKYSFQNDTNCETWSFSAELLHLHIVPQSMCSPAVVDRHSVRTVGGAKITIGCDSTGVTINDQESRFLQDYRFANNGFLSAVNKVLVPNPGE